MGSQYGLLVLLKIPVLGMSYDTHGIFYIPANFVFNLPKYVTSYMHYSGKKKIRLRFVSRGFEPGPSNQLELKHFYPLLFFRRKASSTRHCVGSSTLIELRRNTPIIHVGGSLQLFHTSYMLHPPGWFLSLRLIPLGHASAAQFEI